MKNTSIADDSEVKLWTRDGLQCLLLSNAAGVQIEVRTPVGAPLCAYQYGNLYDAVRRAEKLLVDPPTHMKHLSRLPSTSD